MRCSKCEKELSRGEKCNVITNKGQAICYCVDCLVDVTAKEFREKGEKSIMSIKLPSRQAEKRRIQ